MPLLYKPGDVTTAPNNELLVHAVNCKGVWGSGVAAQLKEKFPKNFDVYKRYCDYAVKDDWEPWQGEICEGYFVDNEPAVMSVFTSFDYGMNRDPEAKILQSTHRAVAELLHRHPEAKFNSPQINGGLFRVPWYKTERIILETLQWYPNAVWTVWAIP